jgi:5-methylcytosine-specific restriction endonuclease McrA
MNPAYKCEHCGKEYKKKRISFLQHIEKCSRKAELRKENVSIKPKKSKDKIPPNTKYKVWIKNVGNKAETKCFCCQKEKITLCSNLPFTFHTGHIKSEANGGSIEIGNLLPICRKCNQKMGSKNWDDYIEIVKLSPRRYGDNIPEKKSKPQVKRKKKRKRKPNYLKPTISFLNKIKN